MEANEYKDRYLEEIEGTTTNLKTAQPQGEAKMILEKSYNITNPETTIDDIITVFMALQEQCFVLGNSLTNLVNKWPTIPPKVQHITREDLSKSGILFVIKD